MCVRFRDTLLRARARRCVSGMLEVTGRRPRRRRLGRVLINAHMMSDYPIFRGNSGKALLIVSISAFDPTQTSDQWDSAKLNH
jgi:hypothetical protein